MSLSTSSGQKKQDFFIMSWHLSLFPSYFWSWYLQNFFFSFIFSFQPWLEKIKAWHYYLEKGTFSSRVSCTMWMGRGCGQLKLFETTSLILADCIAHNFLPEDTGTGYSLPHYCMVKLSAVTKPQKDNLQSKAAGGDCQTVKFVTLFNENLAPFEIFYSMSFIYMSFYCGCFA